MNQYVALRGTSRGVYHYKSEFTLHDTETPQVQDLSELWPWRVARSKVCDIGGPAEETELLDLPSSRLKTWRNLFMWLVGESYESMAVKPSVLNSVSCHFQLMAHSTAVLVLQTCLPIGELILEWLLHCDSDWMWLMLVWDFYRFLMNEYQ